MTGSNNKNQEYESVWEMYTEKQQTLIGVVPVAIAFLMIIFSWDKKIVALQGKVTTPYMGVTQLGNIEGIILLFSILLILFLISTTITLMAKTRGAKKFNTGLYLGIAIAAAYQGAVAQTHYEQMGLVLIFTAVFAIDRIREIWE